MNCGKIIIENGWKEAGISTAVEDRYTKLPPLDPFESLDLLFSKSHCNILAPESLMAVCNIGTKVLEGYERIEEIFFFFTI